MFEAGRASSGNDLNEVASKRPGSVRYAPMPDPLALPTLLIDSISLNRSTILNGDRGRTEDTRKLRAIKCPKPRARWRVSRLRNMGMVTVIAIILADLLVFLLYVYQYRQEFGLTANASPHPPGFPHKPPPHAAPPPPPP